MKPNEKSCFVCKMETMYIDFDCCIAFRGLFLDFSLRRLNKTQFDSHRRIQWIKYEMLSSHFHRFVEMENYVSILVILKCFSIAAEMVAVDLRTVKRWQWRHLQWFLVFWREFIWSCLMIRSRLKKKKKKTSVQHDVSKSNFHALRYRFNGWNYRIFVW